MMMGKKMTMAALAGFSVALLANIPFTAAVCSNGLEGIQSTSEDVCCVEGCGVCGGVGCTPANTSTLTAADCCASEIVASGVLCDVSGAAPCIVTTAAAPNSSVCINGQTGVQDPNTDVCCPLECGDFCGGEGCGSIAGVNASQCCSAAIMASGAVCSDTVDPPCTVVSTAADNSTTCSNGLPGIEDTDNLICCEAACGQCGGSGCGSIPGLTGAECCSDEIGAAGQLCSVTNAAPCVVDPPAFAASMCPNGIPGVQDGNVCCAEECNLQCGGVGCGTIVGTNGASDCCSATILLTGVPCDVGVEAPCIMQNGTYTNAPVAAPTVPGATVAPAAATTNATTTTTPAPVAVAPGVGATEAPAAGSSEIMFSQAPTMLGDLNGDGLVNSADTGIVGDTNGDGVVDGLDTGLIGDTNGDGVVNDLDEDVGATVVPTSAPTAAPVATSAPADAALATGVPTAAPSVSPDGSRDVAAATLAPGDTNRDGVVNANDGIDTNGDGVIDENDGVDTNGDGVINENDGVDTNGDGVIDSNDGVDTNGDGVIDSNDGATAISVTPAPSSDADAEASGNSAMSTVTLPGGPVYAGVVGVAMTVGGMLLL